MISNRNKNALEKHLQLIPPTSIRSITIAGLILFDLLYWFTVYISGIKGFFIVAGLFNLIGLTFIWKPYKLQKEFTIYLGIQAMMISFLLMGTSYYVMVSNQFLSQNLIIGSWVVYFISMSTYIIYFRKLISGEFEKQNQSKLKWLRNTAIITPGLGFFIGQIIFKSNINQTFSDVILFSAIVFFSALLSYGPIMFMKYGLIQKHSELVHIYKK